MALDPISGETLADQAYRRISEAMLSGRLAPGSRLVMDDLAAELSISRTPVRDALYRLEREGLLQGAGRRGGFVVRSLSPGDIKDLYDAREAVEVFAAQRVAELDGYPRAHDHISCAVDRAEMIDLSQPADAFAANRLVHRAVVEATGNTMLIDLFDAVWTRARALQVYSSYFQSQLVHQPIRHVHQPMLDALGQGPTHAAEVMRKHIREGLDATIAAG